jgi:AraC family transcriptional regulator
MEFAPCARQNHPLRSSQPASPSQDQQPAHSACGDPVHELSLLSQQSSQLWSGLPVAWVEAMPHEVHADVLAEGNRLVMIDDGATQAEFVFGRRAQRHEFKPGSIGYFAAGTELRRSRWRWSRTRRIYLDLDPASLGDAVGREPLLALPRQAEIEFHDAELAAVLRAMVAEVAAGSPNGRLYAECLSLGVALRMQARGDRRTPREERARLSAAQLARVEDLLEARLAGDIPLAALADAAGFSAPQFVRLFKNSTGCTPHRYVLRWRLRRAREMVVDSDLPLAVIASAAGFASQSHMTASFVRAFGVPPGQMRRSCRGGVP